MVAQKAALIVIDGWGIAPTPNQPGDAVAAAHTPVMDSFRSAAGYTELEASSLAVGLPEGLMGNSEVGHLNIGAGRVVWQDVVRIDQTVKEGKFLSTPNLKASLQHAKDTNGRLHLLGLVSDGGVHSKNEHLYELLRSAKTMEIPNVYIHFFGDGRDTDPKSSARYMQELLDKIKELDMEGVAKIATVVGRYYAMDRDKRWERVQVALKGLVSGEGEATDDPVAKIREKYEQGETDEFFKPIIVNGSEARLKDNDTLFFFNYRADRVREITLLLGVDSSYLPDPTFTLPKNLHITTMTQYKTEYPFHIAFPPQRMDDVLAEWLSKQGLKQCHIAETEKYAHVTFFFNGGVEKQFENEVRDMIPSPRVATYDLDPPMSALKVAEKMAERLGEGEFEFVMNNFAPPDMVGHTGVYSAAVQAVTATDEAIGVVYEACKKHGYVLFVTSDHGNAEEMLNEEGTPKTSHTLNKVPFVMANAPPESDVWSIGVITYILLCGRRPFWDKTEDGIFKEVLRKKPEFREKPWEKISNSAKDFVKKLLVKDPRARLTAAQALSHPWVREGGDASEIPLDISVLCQMRDFVKYSRLKQFALRALASTLAQEELAGLRDQFDAIDIDKSGSITLEEIRQALAKDRPWTLKESRVLEILQAMDSNRDGLVDFNEFVAATLHVHQLEEHDSEKWQQLSRAAFEKFDFDKDGYITPEELRMHTGLKGSIEPLLEEADIDRDGKISLSEFQRLLRTASLGSRTNEYSARDHRQPRKL